MPNTSGPTIISPQEPAPQESQEPGAPPEAPALSSGTTVMAWVFPSKKICSMEEEYADGRSIDVLKPEYFTVGEAGALILLTEESRGCQGYSKANAASIRAHSSQQYVTVSSAVDGMRSLVSSEENRARAVETLASFAVAESFTGVEIDFEDYGNWDAATYAQYQAFLTELGDALHAKGKKLMVDLPPIGSAKEQGYYLLRYEDMAALPIDYLVVMAYDYQFDHGAGTPLAPNEWVRSIVEHAIATIRDKDRIVIGIPAYSYKGATGGFALTRGTHEDLAGLPGFSSAPRDPESYERIWSSGGVSYVYVDTPALDAKRALIESYGIRHISVWALGGNQWFSR